MARFTGNSASVAPIWWPFAEAERNGFHRAGLPGDWLGGGWYFWQEAPARAWQWADDVVAREARRNPDGARDKPMVLIAELEYTDYWIDLIEFGAWFERLRMVAENLKRLGLLPEQSLNIAASRLHRRDCELIDRAVDTMRLANERVDAIRCAFIEGTAVCEHSAIYDKAHVQIAVKDPAIIRAYMRISRPGEQPRD